MKKKIIVIGSGFGGLGVASRLLSAGHDVTIIEKRDKLGGRAYVYEKKGFKFDGGPTVITAPFMFDDIWEAAGKKRSDYVEFVPCDPFYRIFDHNGEKFDYNNDHEFTIKEIEKRSPGDVAGYEKFLATTKAIFQKGFVELADQPFLKFMDMMKVAPDLIKLQSYKTVYKYVSKFIKDDFLRQCFSFHPLLVGGNPFDTTSIYAMIHYLEREWGVHYAMGGTGAIVNAFEKLIAEQGGKFHLETEVDEILVKNGKAIGVRLKNGDILDADVVVANSDVGFTYKNMIDSKHRRKYTDKKIDRTKYSMSLFVIYFGTKKRYLDSGLAHHNIILGKRYKGLLDDIFHKKHVADDFSLYLHMPTITDSSIAPEGHEGFYVLSPVPHLDSGTDWNVFAPKYRDAIMNFLEENYLPDLQENIVAEHYIDPLHFKEVLNSHKGSAFSVEPILTQSAWFRPHNKSEDVEDLYFVGAGTHPGAGLPGVLSSSIIAQDLIGKA
ncbi:MAG TPA: phytoene desaturase [Balneola sp.]|nr:phytoene dehydrogenase [Bacteroidota bacterium]HCT52045.1 phytoene desaturase [Balneola sp.]|tara:strand:+ start:354 stop:1832 length:1479 start_codon:yes stop_codon:yes gene_type:complete